MIQLNGTWKNDSFLLLSIHLMIDCFFLLGWSAWSSVQEFRLAHLECSPLSTEQHCQKLVWESIVPSHLYPIAIIGTLIAVVYVFLLMDATKYNQHPRTVFVWNAIHLHFMICLFMFLVGRNEYALLFLPLLAIGQDMYSMVRTTVSENMQEKPFSESETMQDDNLVYGCIRIKKENSRFFLFSCC